jgi:hypothetical protein
MILKEFRWMERDLEISVFSQVEEIRMFYLKNRRTRSLFLKTRSCYVGK